MLAQQPDSDLKNLSLRRKGANLGHNVARTLRMMARSGDAIAVLNRTEQQRRFGVDCGDVIEFEAGTWIPGGEHVKKIVVKNVSRRTIKFKYELPTTKYFSMAFPTLTTLSPGMHTTLDVAFRPVKLEEYDDFTTFSVQIIEGGVAASEGSFRLPVFARIARLAVEIPKGLDFGFCPTAETSELKFLLRNVGQVDSLFDWSIAGAGEHGRPFAIHPSSGRVEVGASLELTASFSPTVASVYVTTTVCSIRAAMSDERPIQTPGSERTMKLSGISKFTYVSASETELNFGSILVGSANTSYAPTEREFILRNRSLVRANFQVQRVETDCDSVFSFHPMNGTVAPESSIAIHVRYNPTSAGSFTCDHFDIVTPGGNRERITCKGRAIGPRVSLWKKTIESKVVMTRSINFGDVVVGKTASRVLILRNESPIEVFFHFDGQERGIFNFGRINGRIPPGLVQNVTISFSPSRVGNFYRRFFLLIQNQSTIYVDMLGTSYDDKVRPSPFQQAHVDAYRLRAASGLGLLSPDQLEVYWRDNGDKFFRPGVQHRTKNFEFDGNAFDADPEYLSSARSCLLTRSGEATLADVDICDEYFVSIENRDNPIVVHETFLDFGSCNLVEYLSKKVLHVTNNTHGKVTCSWWVTSAESETCTFQVFPETLDISAGATAEFRITFQPLSSDTYYFAELEGYVAFKSNRTFRLVNVETFTPPWCIVSKARGNTFSSPTDQFLSKVSFRLPRKRINFPPCYLGESVFQTILLENAGDTPALFAFVEDPSGTFTCKPSYGYISTKSFHLVQIRFRPHSSKSYLYTLNCIINNAQGTPEKLELTGIGAVPTVLLQDRDAVDGGRIGSTSDVRLFIKPTGVGLLSERTIAITNTSRVPLVFRCEVPRKLQGVFDIIPKLGRLNGRESATVTCRFTPQDERAYSARVPISIKPISIARTTHSTGWRHTKVPVLQEETLRIHTTGTCGTITFEPESTTFETILVNSSSSKAVSIVNKAECDLQFSLSQSIRITGGDGSAQDQAGRSPTKALAKLVFSRSSGLIPARSSMQIIVSFLPRVAGVFAFTVTCRTSIHNGERNEITSSGTQQIHHCHIQAEASFPTVVIEDIRVPHLATSLAWSQFLCHEINDYMSRPPSFDSAADTNSTTVHAQNHVLGQAEENDDTKHVAVPFSPAPHGATTQHVFLKLRNPGNLVVEFAIKYPKEDNVEIEHWAETGAPSSDEIRTSAIIDSNVFRIAPRRATVLPQQSITLSLSYAYTSMAYGGIHDLRVLFQVDKGKSLVLELQGRTLPSNEPKLFLSRRVIALSPVMIGEFKSPIQSPQEMKSDERPPRQRIVVSNRGDAAFRLDVTSNSFSKINQHDYGGELFSFPVLRCVTTSEIVAPRSSVFVEVEFVPIEPKKIVANLIVKAYGLMGAAYKEVAMVTIIATGFHPVRTNLPELRRELALATGGGFPTRQLIAVPGQSARFQCDSVSFFHVPTHAKQSMLLVLVNDTLSHVSPSTVRFDWDATNPLVCSGQVSFYPTKGELLPGQEILIHVTVFTTDQPVVIDDDISCWITTMTSNGSHGAGATGIDNPMGGETSMVLQHQTWSSVITKSTATQAATSTKALVPIESASTVRNAMHGATRTTNGTVDVCSYPLFVHVYAHVLRREVFELFLLRNTTVKLPLPTVQQPALRSPTTSTLVCASEHTAEELKSRQQVVEEVLEMLLIDVLSSDAVHQAVEDKQRLESTGSDSDGSAVFRSARTSEDCAAIATDVVENTVSNVLQELFYGDIALELSCVPLNKVFPKIPSPRRSTNP